MKYLLVGILLLVLYIGWIGLKFFNMPPDKQSIDMLIFDDDTIVVKGANVIDHSKLHNYFIYGHYDTLTGITYIEIKLDTVIWYEDSRSLEGIDSITINGKHISIRDSTNVIKIATHKGDIIIDNGVKNVYNNQ